MIVRAGRPEVDASWSLGKLRGLSYQRGDGRFDSIQWVDLPADPGDLTDLERTYYTWVPRLTAGFVRPHRTSRGMFIGVEPLGWPRLIVMGAARGSSDLREREIHGGYLARAGGTMGFECSQHPGGTRLVVALRGLDPRLPSWIYLRIQRRLHERSTFGFLRQISRCIPLALRHQRALT